MKKILNTSLGIKMLKKLSIYSYSVQQGLYIEDILVKLMYIFFDKTKKSF